MKNYNKPRNEGSIAFGVILLCLGIILLLRKFDLFIPSWLLSWPMILIAAGTYTLVTQQFKSLLGSAVLFLGVYFLLEREFDLDLGLGQFIWPLGLIVLGIYLITQKKREQQVIDETKKNWESSRKNKSATTEVGVLVQDNPEQTTFSEEVVTPISETGFTRATGTSFVDRIQESVIFSGVNRKLMTKNFEGGKVTVIFGGLDIDLTQADFTGVVTLDMEVGFGGVKLFIPPHWDIRTEVSVIAAGLEDKRMFREGGVDTSKVLILKGTILFGGLEIKSF